MKHINLEINHKKDATDSASLAPAKKVTSAAFGKAILIGEHAVVYGASAIGLPLIGRGLELELKVVDSDNPNKVTLGNDAFNQVVENLVQDSFDLLGLEKTHFTLQGSSALPIGAGLGSSAVICVAIIRAIAKMHHTDLEPSRLANLANQLEARFHGTPSGLDASIVAYESPILFKRGTPMQTLNLEANNRKSIDFVIIDSGARANTIDQVKICEPYFRGIRGNVRLQRFEALANQAQKALIEPDLEIIADIMREANRKLTDAGVVTPQLSDYCTRIEEVGCLAAKITGAGGGGCLLGILPKLNKRVIISKLVDQYGETSVIPFSI